MSLIEGPEIAKDTTQQFSVIHVGGSGIDGVVLPPETTEPAYKVEARAEFYEHLDQIRNNPPARLGIHTLPITERAKQLFQDAGVEVIARERTTFVPLLPTIPIAEPSESGFSPRVIDATRIIRLVREEPLDVPMVSDEPPSDFDQLVDSMIVESITDLYSFVYDGHAKPDRFGINHLDKKDGDGETRETFRKNLSPEDRAIFEKATKDNQMRKYAITRVASSLSVLSTVLHKLQLAPDKARQLAIAQEKISYLFEGDTVHGIPRYINAPQDEKLAMVRLVVDKAVEGLELTLGSDPDVLHMSLFVT